MHDHAESNQFEMPQKSIAAMLGVRREGITEAAGKLQAARLITYRRASIRILDEAGLKKKSCECYRFIRRQFDSLLSDVPRFLSSQSRNRPCRSVAGFRQEPAEQAGRGTRPKAALQCAIGQEFFGDRVDIYPDATTSGQGTPP
jgi:Crp-like helix-turn-helix domain